MDQGIHQQIRLYSTKRELLWVRTIWNGIGSVETLASSFAHYAPLANAFDFTTADNHRMQVRTAWSDYKWTVEPPSPLTSDAVALKA